MRKYNLICAILGLVAALSAALGLASLTLREIEKEWTPVSTTMGIVSIPVLVVAMVSLLITIRAESHRLDDDERV